MKRTNRSKLSKTVSDIPLIQRVTTVESLMGPRSVYRCYYTYDLLGKID